VEEVLLYDFALIAPVGYRTEIDLERFSRGRNVAPVRAGHWTRHRDRRGEAPTTCRDRDPMTYRVLPEAAPGLLGRAAPLPEPRERDTAHHRAPAGSRRSHGWFVAQRRPSHSFPAQTSVPR